MALIDDVKTCLRISSISFDDEISDLVDAAKADLQLSGILASKISTDDPLIKRCIVLYCKCHFSFDNPDYERLLQAYNSLKNHLCLSAEYTVEVVV